MKNTGHNLVLTIFFLIKMMMEVLKAFTFQKEKDISMNYLEYAKMANSKDILLNEETFQDCSNVDNNSLVSNHIFN